MTTNNSFLAFGFDEDEATIDTLRTDLAIALRNFIAQGQLSQKKAAQLFGLTQNVVSQIVRGDIEHLSVERLIRAMVKANIPGYAEWGGSAELARACSGYRPTGTTVLFQNAKIFDAPIMPTERPAFAVNSSSAATESIVNTTFE